MTEGAMAQPVLEVDNLKTYFLLKRGVVKAVDGVSFTLEGGKTLGVVGESGSGKSVTCLSLMRLVPSPPGQIVGGRVLLQGEDLLQKSESEMRHYRGRGIAMILQDPMVSLDPVFRIGDQIGESVRAHQENGNRNVGEKTVELLRQVKIPSPGLRVSDFPHHLSGGMRQRVVAAMAMGCRPQVLIADEPTTALDVTIQAQFLRLLRDIREETGVAVIFVTHDLGIVAQTCDHVLVMYAGRAVESGDVRRIFKNPIHPYTVALMKSVPKLGGRKERLFQIPGQPPDLLDLPQGCSLWPRCEHVMPICREEYPPAVDLGDDGFATCWLANEGR
jgi:oligopeptide/dipeptide ABC transporter ATP-binding protein